MAPTANGQFVARTHDYHLLYTYLDAFETKHQKESFYRKRKKAKEEVLYPGFRKETLDDLPKEVFAKFEKYCLCTDGNYRLSDLDRDLDRMRSHVGHQKRMRLINDYRVLHGTPRRRRH